MADSLPTEVQLMVLRHVDLADVKNWRLVCKSYNYAAIPLLFRTVVMFPSVRSVGNAKSIAGARHLAPYVLSLEYVPRGLPNRFRLLADFSRKVNASNQSPFSLSKLSPDVQDNHKKYLKELASQAKYNHCQEIEALVLLGSSFYNLQKIAVSQHNVSGWHSYTNIPRGFVPIARSASTNHACEPGDWNHFHDLFMACADRCLQEIVCDHLVWTSLLSLNSVFEEYPNYGQSVRRLCLHASNHDFRSIRDLPNMKQVYAEQLGTFLQTFRNLEELTLNFGTDFRSSGRELQLLTDMLVQRFWPRLCSLRLTTITPMDDSFFAFLTRHSKTLRTLYLANVRLPAGPGETVSSFLHEVRNALHLEEAQLGGFWVHTGAEAWEIRPSPQPSCEVLEEIKLFLCRRAPYPIPPDAVERLVDLTARGDYDSLRNSEYARSECSFRWNYMEARRSLEYYGDPGDPFWDTYGYEADHEYHDDTFISTHYGFAYDERGFFGDPDEYSLYEDYSDSRDSWASSSESENEDDSDRDGSDRGSDSN